MALLKITHICQPSQSGLQSCLTPPENKSTPTAAAHADDHDKSDCVPHSASSSRVATSVPAPSLIDHAVFAAGNFSSRPKEQHWTTGLVSLGLRIQYLLTTHRVRQLSATLQGWTGVAWISGEHYVRLRLIKDGIGCISLTFSAERVSLSVDVHPECLQASPDHSTAGNALSIFKGELDALLNALLRANPEVSTSGDRVRMIIGSIQEDQRPLHDLASTLSILSVSSPIDAPVRAVSRKTIDRLNSGQWSEHIDEFLLLSRNESLRPYLAAQTRLLEVLRFKFLSGLGSRTSASFDAGYLTVKIGKWPDEDGNGKRRPFHRKAQVYNKSAHISTNPDATKSVWWTDRYAALGWTNAGVEFIRFDGETGKRWFKDRDVQRLGDLNHVPTIDVALGVLGHLRSKLPQSWDKLHQRLYGEAMPSGAGVTELRRERRRKIALDLVELHQAAMALFKAFAQSAGVKVPEQSKAIQCAVQRWRTMKKAPVLKDLFDLIEAVEQCFRKAIANAQRSPRVDNDAFAAGKFAAAKKSRIAQRNSKQRDSVKKEATKEIQMEKEPEQPSRVEPIKPASLEARPPQRLKLMAAAPQTKGTGGQRKSEEPLWLTPKEVKRRFGVSTYLLRRMADDGLLVPVAVAVIGKRKIMRYRQSDVEEYQRAMDLL